MPDEAPVCDVLCTATDYLCRLGSNLRTRSENLRDKKISKSKLKNSHAIRKAADKVLLICELTKKSIVNVESSVKSILSAIGASQIGSEGDKICSGNNTNNKFQYIECDSVKIRVSKSVPLKHYMSVKVHALCMPLSMQEKYPVYYNCKLYRHRKRQPVRSSRDTKETISNSDSINVSLDGKNTEPNSIQKNMEGKQESEHSNSSEKSKSSITCSSEKKHNVEDNNTNETIDNHVNNNVSKSTSDKVNDESIAKKICIKTSSSRTKSLDTDSESISRKKEKSHECDESKSSREKESNIKRRSLEQYNKSLVGYTQNNVQENKEESIKISSLKKTSKTSQKKKHLILSSDEENQSENNVTSDKDNNESMRDEEEIKESLSELKSPKKLKCNKTGLKGKRSSMTIVSSDSDNLDENDQVNNIDKLDSCKDDSITVAEGNLTISSKGDSVTNVAGDDNSQEVQKPMIKCVSLSKLLKPDIVDKTKKTPTKESPSKAGSSKTSEKTDNIHKNDKITKKGFTDLKKRTDVANFKPKSFAIHITRLPKLTVKFLQTHNLNKITKDGEVIVTIPSSPVVAPSTKANQEGPISKAINEAKTVLLDDSDGDNTDLLQKNAEDPVSGSVITETNVSTGHKSPTHSDTDKNKDKSPPATPPSKRKSASDGLTPKSKRRRIMENMHAKKMLLTYSSDSDTDDEKLRAVMKEMKESLLKGTSSGEDEDKDVNTKSEKEVIENLEPEKTTPESSEKKLEENNKKLSSPSESSEEDIFDKIKRRAHIKKDDKKNQSGTDTDATKGKKHSSSSKMGRTKRSGGSSNQNSDTQETNDKDIDGLTNLDTLIKKNRRRDSTSTQSTNRTSSSGLRSSRRMPKAKPVDSDNILPVESSSDEASGGENADEGVEDLPVVSLSELNGSAVDHLAKDDLLEESDSSHENDKGDEDAKPQESDDEDNLKSKRRKPQNTISSDSEVGSSRKKDARISDFEASDDSQPANQSKRRKKATDSDESVGSSDSTRKKKRRRIKPTNDSDGTGSDTENEGRNKHGRKNIRKVMGKNQLEEATKRAAREEKERIARIADRQKLYNNMQFDESGKPDEVVLDKVVLDFDPETKDPLIQVDRGLVKKLKPHQANGIKFMWDACFESVKRIKKDKGSGCILAHCMGLGKTLQVVTLTHTLLTHSNLTKVKRVLVVCPLSTVLNWVNEFRMWLKYTENECDIDVYELSRYKQNSERAYQLSQWFAHGGVCVLGYEMFRNLSSDTNKKFKKKMLKNFQESLVNPGPDMVVCDEGHLLKNEKTSLSQSMNRVTTLRRIVLTGTPLQNNLKEYYCMVQFVKPNLLGKYNEYLNRFVNPITNGQYTDSTEHDIRVMKRRSHVLHKMLDGSVQRRDYGVLAPFLPPKHEYVLFITLSAVQIKLYQHYLDNYSRRPLPGKSSGFLFPDFQSLQRIWTHPLVLKYNSERYEIMQQKKREREEEDSEGSLVDFIDDDDSTPDETSSEDSSEDLSDMSDDSRKKSKKKKSAKKSKGKDAKGGSRRGTRANPVEIGAEEEVKPDVTESRNENPTEWWMPLVTDDELEDMRHSHKLVLLFDILRQCDTIGDKLLVFSQSLYSLDLIEHFLGKVDEATQENRIDEKLCGHVGSWSPGVDYFRLDGSTSCENRSIWCKNFNREDNPRARLFLISTRAGGLGINLVAANRVVIFDVSWNPSHDVQSIFRVYRFGQKKPCYVYRFLAMGTMEEKIYERQVTKQAISKRVIDEQQIDRHYAENDLAELYKFEPIPPPRQLPPLPKDRLFAEMLKEHENQIYKYHEHDSLLENKEEETLTEEERKAAWEDFENEKNRPPPAPFQAWPMHNGMMPNLLAQQQQQLAYAALAQMLRKDMPTINDNQIRDMLPLIYNSNPGLMQKMSEIYKYTQPGMMQSMMNPAMHSGAAGGGSGGSSGLQYEPPWQRQQQLRMQQLMQQQNMGANAKYYAGGLGSRDPVAMALQQQRAREIMLGERARPRGRPPLAPRVPASDVVNLDSD